LLEERDRSPEPDAHLMHRLGIERPHTICIGGEMPQRRISDGIEGFTGCHFRMKLDGLGTGRRLVIAVRQPIPALGFGTQIELAAGSTLAVSSQSEQVGRPTCVYRKLKLGRSDDKVRQVSDLR
jgi:hypothetical protein